MKVVHARQPMICKSIVADRRYGDDVEMEEWGRVRRDVASVIASVTPKDGKGPGQGLEAWSSGQDPKRR